jgi:hypothetical protein
LGPPGCGWSFKKEEHPEISQNFPRLPSLRGLEEETLYLCSLGAWDEEIKIQAAFSLLENPVFFFFNFLSKGKVKKFVVLFPHSVFFAWLYFYFLSFADCLTVGWILVREITKLFSILCYKCDVFPTSSLFYSLTPSGKNFISRARFH